MYEPFYYDRYTHNSRWEFSEKDEVSFYMEEMAALNKDIETDICEKADVVVYASPYTTRRR